MSAEGLRQALAALGIECTVEARDKLAVIISPAGGTRLDDVAVRRAALALIRDHGFTHLALEIPDGPNDHAAVSRD